MLRPEDASASATATIGPIGVKTNSDVPKPNASRAYTPAATVPAIASGAESCGAMIARAQTYPTMKWSTAFATNAGELPARAMR